MARRRRNNRKRTTYRTRTYRPTQRVRSVPVRISKGVQRYTAYTPYPSPPKKTKTYSRSITITSNAQTNTKKFKGYNYQNQILSTVTPETLICARRAQRKQIMHAMKHAGKSGQKRPTNNKYRKVQC